MCVNGRGYLPLACSLKEAAKQFEIELGETISNILGSIKAIKDEMLDLEKKISVRERDERVYLQGLLRKKSNELNDLSDSIVLMSREAWVKFNNLAQRCESEEADPSLLEPIRVLCKRIEVIAADLLCFSLGH
jgi:hypothetical protein